MAEQVYLDYNASAPLCPEAKQAMIAAMDVSGNPSSVHASGRAARKIVDHARRTIAELVGVILNGSFSQAVGQRPTIWC
ncbi:MAG: aminotransferase class V-fold PLP-dependent enzyme [Thalassospira sp.]|uniref:aminotransferase class V-fold PLP-dependent enzyme n=1 Tax=Thalassospira sp. TaxID=1912094 RepID=UPI003A85E183